MGLKEFFESDLDKVMKNERITRQDRARYYSLEHVEVEDLEVLYQGFFICGAICIAFCMSGGALGVNLAGEIALFAMGGFLLFLAILFFVKGMSERILYSSEFKELDAEFTRKYGVDWRHRTRKEYSVNELIQKGILK